MDQISVFNEEGVYDPIPQEVLDFVAELNYLRDEGFLQAEEGEDGVVRLYPTDE